MIFVGRFHRQFLGALGASVMAVLLAPSPARAQFGDSLPGVGPINRSMGGAAVAAPIDAAGALFWNPATIAGLPSSELETAFELLIVRTSLSSRIAAGALGPGLPPRSLYGHTGGNDGVFPLPIVGLVYRPENNPFWT